MPPPNKLQPIIIKKVKKGGHDAHSSAWKIALADFMTALMCFFLVMWLTTILNTDTKPDVSRFFNMSGVDETDVGIGGILGGSTITVDGPLSQMAAEFTVVPPMGAVAKNDEQVLGRYLPKSKGAKAAALALDLEMTKQKRLKAVAQAIAQDLKKQPDIGKYIRMTDEKQYIRIDFLDVYPKPMFAVGERELLPEAQRIVQHVAQTLTYYAGTTSIEGHTDALAYHDTFYTNWELSSDRANATRRFLSRRVPELKINAVVGKGDQRLKEQSGPIVASNRRVSLLFYPQESASQSTDSVTVEAAEQQLEVHHKASHVKSLEELVEGEEFASGESSSRQAEKKAVKYFI